MDYAALKNELDDPAYTGMDDVAIADALMAPTLTEVQPVPKTRLVIWAAQHDVIRKLEAAEEANTPISGVAAAALEMLRNAQITALHLDDPYAQQMLGVLVAGGVVTQAQVDDLTALATVPVSRAQQLGLGTVVGSDIGEMRRLYGIDNG